MRWNDRMMLLNAPVCEIMSRWLLGNGWRVQSFKFIDVWKIIVQSRCVISWACAQQAIILSFKWKKIQNFLSKSIENKLTTAVAERNKKWGVGNKIGHSILISPPKPFYQPSPPPQLSFHLLQFHFQHVNLDSFALMKPYKVIRSLSSEALLLVEPLSTIDE